MKRRDHGNSRPEELPTECPFSSASFSPAPSKFLFEAGWWKGLIAQCLAKPVADLAWNPG